MSQSLFLCIVFSFLNEIDILPVNAINRFPAHRHSRIQYEVLEPLQKRSFRTRAGKMPESSRSDRGSHSEQGTHAPAFARVLYQNTPTSNLKKLFVRMFVRADGEIDVVEVCAEIARVIFRSK